MRDYSITKIISSMLWKLSSSSSFSVVRSFVREQFVKQKKIRKPSFLPSCSLADDDDDALWGINFLFLSADGFLLNARDTGNRHRGIFTLLLLERGTTFWAMSWPTWSSIKEVALDMEVNFFRLSLFLAKLNVCYVRNLDKMAQNR